VCVCGRGGGQVRRLGPFLSSLGVASGCGAGETKSPTVGGQGHMGTSELAPASRQGDVGTGVAMTPWLALLLACLLCVQVSGPGPYLLSSRPIALLHNIIAEKRSYSCTAVVIEIVRVWRVRCGARARGY